MSEPFIIPKPFRYPRKPPVIKTEVISERFYQQNQSWNWELTIRVRGRVGTRSATPGDWRRMRIKIRRNAYDFQSYGQVELWDGDKWNEVVRTPIDELSCKSVSYVQDRPDLSKFQDDGHKLLAEAAEVTLPALA